MKKTVLTVALISNFLLFAVFIGIFLSSIFKLMFLKDILIGDVFSCIRSILSYVTFGFSIYNLYIWAKYDKRITIFFLLFFLMGLYTPFYYLNAKRKGWV